MRNKAVKSGWIFTRCPRWWHLGTACEICAIRLNDLPHLYYQQVGSSECGPEATFGLGSYSQYAFKALDTGLDLGSITCFSFHSIRSNPSRAVPVSNTACCSCRGWGWTVDLTTLRDSVMAIHFRIVHQFQNMKLFRKTCLHLFQQTLESRREIADSQTTQPYSTWGHSLTTKLPLSLKATPPYPCISPNQCHVDLSKVFTKYFLFCWPVLLFPIHILIFSFAGWKADPGTHLRWGKQLHFCFSSSFLVCNCFVIFTLDNRS